MVIMTTAMMKTIVMTILTIRATMTTTIDCEYFLISEKNREMHAPREKRKTRVIGLALVKCKYASLLLV